MSDDDDEIDLSAVQRLDALIVELRAIGDEYAGITERAHAAVKDLNAAVRAARQEVQESSRDAVRRHLAREHERIAATVREQIKQSTQPKGPKP